MSKNTLFFKAPRYLFRKYNIIAIINKYPDIKTFTDIGCGAGELACTLAEKGKTGVAVDFSDEAIMVADNLRDKRGINKSALKFMAGDLNVLPQEKSDLVICCEVLEHIKNDKKFLHDLITYTNKYVLLSVPAKRNLYDSSDESVGHYRRYDKVDLEKLLSSENLKIIDFINYGYPFTDIIRIFRKLAFNNRLSNNKTTSMDNRSKDSGINPIKIPRRIAKIDIEKIIAPFYYISRIFNKYDLSEGYLVLCERQQI